MTCSVFERITRNHRKIPPRQAPRSLQTVSQPAQFFGYGLGAEFYEGEFYGNHYSIQGVFRIELSQKPISYGPCHLPTSVWNSDYIGAASSHRDKKLTRITTLRKRKAE